MNELIKKFEQYCVATNGNKSMEIIDRNTSGLKTNDFIFMYDNFESLRELMQLYRKTTKTVLDKETILKIISNLGGSDASDRYAKGWDDAVDTIYNQIEQMEQ